MTFSRLVRYESDGQVSYGELLGKDDGGYKVQRLKLSTNGGFDSSGDEPIMVKTLLCPVEKTPLIICVGLNYRKHAAEAGLTVPKYPVIFTKPADALAGPFDSISIHPDAQQMLDYEGELTVVIGMDAKNVSEEHALDFVLGYTAGNDISARNFQLPEVSGGQFCFAKSMDEFAPVGPAIFSKELIPDPQKLKYVLKVNGVEKQSTSTDDMIWSVRQIIAHLSKGTTLRKGTLIMTGTPSGVGYFRNEFLKNRDEVEMEIEGFGSIVNKMVFE